MRDKITDKTVPIITIVKVMAKEALAQVHREVLVEMLKVLRKKLPKAFGNVIQRAGGTSIMIIRIQNQDGNL